jgi:primosomal protein N' (replication factor Y)
MFQGAKVARLDRDVARRKGALEEALATFRGGETQVLVGTQMVAKGLDFPNVTVVGVVAADVSLNVPDFRAGERTFQLLSQVAGRAGRGAAPGHVVIQTFNPKNVAVVATKEHDYEGFFEEELAMRAEAEYPPFVRLVDVLTTGPNRQDVFGLAALAAQRLRSQLSAATVLGPADCAIEKLQNLWRRHILVKLPTGTDPGPVGTALAGLKSGTARIQIDVDPAALL